MACRTGPPPLETHGRRSVSRKLVRSPSGCAAFLPLPILISVPGRIPARRVSVFRRACVEQASMSQRGLSGNLGTMTLPDLLPWASRGQKTGTLALKSGSVTKRIFLRDGVIVGSSSNDPRDYLGQVLLSEGLISEQQLKDAMDHQARTRVLLGRILVQRSLVSETRMAAALKQKAEETIYSLFLWPEAAFEFTDGELPGEQVLISVQVEEVLLEGVRRYDTSCKIRELLPHNHLVLARADKPLAPDIAARAFDRKIFDLVDGRRSVA